MDKKKYIVTITETLTYAVEVEANSLSEAEDLAFESDKFTQNLCDDNDAEVTNIVEVLD